MPALLKAIPQPKYQGPTLQLSKYTANLISPPKKVYWEYKVPAREWGMLGNDTVGDCEIARIAHMLMLFTAHTGKMVVPTLSEVMAVYSKISGYVPGDQSTDVGCSTPDVLNYWQTVGISGHKIAGWAQVDPTQQAIEQCVWLFGGCAIDIAIYESMMQQFQSGQSWDNPSGELDGYHAVPAEGYGADGCTVVTWGTLQQMGWLACMTVLQGAFAVITQDWIEATGKAPNGFDLAALKADLTAMTSGS